MGWLFRKSMILIFWLLVTFSVLLAIFTLSVGKLLPYLDYYRPQIERNLQQIIGHPVSLQRIDGQLEGIDPTVSVSEFVLNVNGQSAIKIDEMRIRLDTVKSLLNLSPHFTYIRFVKPAVNLREIDGEWRLSGAVSSNNANNTVAIERILDYLYAQRNFSILDANLHVTSDQYGGHDIRIPHVYLFQKSFESLLNATFYLDDSAAPFVVNARLDKTRSLVRDYRIKAAISAPATKLPSALFTDNALSTVELGGSIWLDARIGKEIEVRSEATQLNMVFDDGKAFELRSSIRFKYTYNNPSVRIDIRALQMKDDQGLTYPASNAVFDWSSVTGRSNLRFDRADVALSHRFAQYFIPQKTTAAQLLKGLSPEGVAKNALVRWWSVKDKVSFEFLSNVHAAAIQSYKGIPQASDVNAVLSLSNDGGYVDFRGKGSELKIDTVYDTSWITDDLAGYVTWQKLDDAFLVNGRDLLIARHGADVSGGFRLEVRDNQPNWLALDLHGKNLSVEDRLEYLPKNALSGELTRWIDDAFVGRGTVTAADILLNGELSEGRKPHVRVKLAVSEADIEFDKNWPLASKVSGVFDFDGTGVSVAIESGRLLDLPLNNLMLTVPVIDGVADWLNLKGSVNEEAERILTTLRLTPLADSILKPFEQWHLGGDVKGEFSVAIPFSKERQPTAQLMLNFQDNLLRLDDIQLMVHLQRGQFRYGSEVGVTDSEFDIEALGGLSHLVLTSEYTAEGRLAVLGDLTGNVAVKNLAKWHKLPSAAIEKLSGEMSYSGQLAINKSQEGQIDLVVDSNLFGTQIRLPEPIGKGATEPNPLRVKVMKHESDMVIDVDYAAFSKARVLLQDARFVGGELVFGGAQEASLSAKIPRNLVVKGDLNRLYVEDWLSVFNDFSRQSDRSDANARLLAMPDWLSQIDLIVDSVVVNDINTWHNAKVSYRSEGKSVLQLSADEMNVSLSEKMGVPDLHFGFLSWNTLPSDELSSNKEAPIKASQIPTMTLSLDQFYLNENPYGDWQMAITREGNVITVEPLSTQLKTGRFTGRMIWQDVGVDSNVDLTLVANGADLAELTGKFSSEAFVSSKEYSINVGLGWKGHPFSFDRSTASGSIEFFAENGNFRKVDELPVFLKALGIFNIGALSRRLLLDFSDVYEPGLTYDEFAGALFLKQGILQTRSPITIVSPTAELSVSGQANIVNETLDETLTATFPLTGTLPLAGLLWGTPQLAGLLYITDKLIGEQLSKVTSVQYKVEGSFSDPSMTVIRYRPLEKSK
ncbi:YhdP family protein [Marinomonas sp. IMCC 4694]|uniref:YhdP family protein n=1 Tax=Marinomonas sp. IMCC 4694 TaxID=2605432 RepID=UPI0011E64A6C|nr:YhdP family protein [Marinomonas sp. IMCC 4694]TYL48073.1 TIGR02099 family protein [Marinomonas sp. IMCC 4694]